MSHSSTPHNVTNVGRNEVATDEKRPHRSLVHKTSSVETKGRGVLEPAEFTPLWASAWADAIISFWQISMADGRLDDTEPIDILDLMPGTGQSVLQMVQALRSRLVTLPSFKGVLRYLIVAPRREVLGAFRNHLELQPHFADGTLVTAIWDFERANPCLLHPGKREPWHPCNPVVVLAHDCWALEHQQLLAVHYGKLLEADIGRLANCMSPEQEAKEWRPAKLNHSGNPLKQVVEGFKTKFNSVPVTVPVGALKQLDRISALATQGYFIFATGYGFTSERQIRLGSFSDLVSTYRAKAVLPLNFYLISQYCAELSARSWQANIRTSFAAQVVIGNFPDLLPYAPAVDQLMASILACDTPSFVETARIVSSSSRKDKLDMLLTLLRRAEYDPAVFDASAAAIVQGMRDTPELERSPWIDALSRVWANHFPCQQTVPLHRSLAPAAMRMGAWSLARKAITRGLQVHGDAPLDLAHLAWCEMRTGNASVAITLAERAVALDGEGRTVREVWETIRSKREGWTGGWATCLPSTALPIVLEPLDLGHAEALCYQYRDPQIAIMTGLPPLVTVEATREWIREHLRDVSRRPYVAIHRQHGLVGFVCLSITNEVGYLCFWIGTDFQGTGLSVEAAKLVIENARLQKIQCLFTSAYQDNIRSLAALQKTGFAVLNVRALAPESDRVFLFMNLGDVAMSNPEKSLVLYYEQERLPLYFPGQEKRRQEDRETAEQSSNVSAER